MNIEPSMTYRPKIGITMRLEIATGRYYLGRDYSEAVVAAGGTPVQIPLIPDKAYLTDLVSGLDGILLPGSDSDVDPFRFGEQPHLNLGTVVPDKDETDLLVLEEAEKRCLPVFAICFGLQVLNVFRGGTLVQDIRSQVPGAIKHQQGIPVDRRSHSISIEKNSLLERALGVGVPTTNVNSHHHQAIAKLGNNLRVVAVAADEIIEAVEDDREWRFTFGAQWHPELDWKNDSLSRFIFKEFVQASANARSTKAAG
jgi:putative glutamine amidotransferase